MGRSIPSFMTLAQYLLFAATYGLCVGVAAGTFPGVLASAAILALIAVRLRAESAWPSGSSGVSP
jgi:hypothetical protein